MHSDWLYLRYDYLIKKIIFSIMCFNLPSSGGFIILPLRWNPTIWSIMYWKKLFSSSENWTKIRICWYAPWFSFLLVRFFHIRQYYLGPSHHTRQAQAPIISFLVIMCMYHATYDQDEWGTSSDTFGPINLNTIDLPSGFLSSVCFWWCYGSIPDLSFLKSSARYNYLWWLVVKLLSFV